MELELALGHQGAAGDIDLGEPAPDDIPFGGAGYWLAPALTFEATRGALRWLVRGRYRVFANAFPELVGAKEASDFVTDGLNEGLAHSPSLELSLRYTDWGAIQPVVSGFAEALVPADDSARTGGFFRLLLGTSFPGGRGELLPFASFDVGNGQGLLINRRQARLSFGVRYGF